MSQFFDVTASEVLAVLQLWERSLPGIPMRTRQLEYLLRLNGMEILTYAISETQLRRENKFPAMDSNHATAFVTSVCKAEYQRREGQAA